MSFSSDLMKYLQEGAEATADIEAVLESVCPTPRFVSDDPYALGLEAINYMDEAYIDLVSYQAEGNQLMLESVNSVDEYKMGVIVDSINEGVKEKAQALGQRMIQAIKGFIAKIRSMIAKHSIEKMLRNMAKDRTFTLSNKENEAVDTITQLTKDIQDAYIEVSDFIKRDFTKYLNDPNHGIHRKMTRQSYGMHQENLANYRSTLSGISDKLKNDTDAATKIRLAVEKNQDEIKGSKLAKDLLSLNKIVNASIGRWTSILNQMEKTAASRESDDPEHYKEMHMEVRRLMAIESGYINISFQTISMATSIFNRAVKRYLKTSKVEANDKSTETK